MVSSSEIYIGLMSGTSLDGVDIAIVDFAQYPPNLIHCKTWSYEPSLRRRIREITMSGMVSLDDLCALDVELGNTCANIVNRTLDATDTDRSRISAIGNHGQTIRHNPVGDSPYSLQTGDPNIIAAKTGITTLADFRRKDIALGGQGAPLAPAFHQFMFASESSNRAIINIGGIANITFLPARSELDILGFDTGPGNVLLDSWMSQHNGPDFDECGNWAKTGNIVVDLLDAMLVQEPYFEQLTPKSTGTEYFNLNWLLPRLNPDYKAQDVQTTLVELTARTIALGIAQLPAHPTECYICGGGVHNHYLIKRLELALPNCAIRSTAHLGLDPDYVEAAAFAWLARQSLNQRTGNLPTVTRAIRAAVLGGIYFP